MSTIEATWPALGTLDSIDITGRNGYGEWGGRVTTMTLVGTDHDVSLTGDAFAGALGLKSNWFTTNATLGAPAVGMAATPSGAGYRLAGSNGAVAVFGDAGFSGSAATLALTRPVVGMAATPDGRGYWLVASDGGIFSYGDARFYGSTGAIAPQPTGGGHGRHPRRPGLLAGGLRRRHLQLSATPASTAPPGPSTSTNRWWAWPPPPTAGATGWWPPTAASSPSVTPASTARPGPSHLNRPVVGMAATPDGRGYWLVASDGGIFAFGDAGFYGSTGNIVLARPVVGMASASRGQGYWLVASDGGIFAFGDAPFYGSAAG